MPASDAAGWAERDAGWKVEVRVPNGAGTGLDLTETWTHLNPGPILTLDTYGDALGCSRQATVTCGAWPGWKRNRHELHIYVLGATSGVYRPLYLGRVTDVRPQTSPDGETWQVSLMGHHELSEGGYYASTYTLTPTPVTPPALPALGVTVGTLGASLSTTWEPTSTVADVLGRALETYAGRGTWGVRPERVAVAGVPELGQVATVSAAGLVQERQGYEAPSYVTEWRNWPGAGWAYRGGSRSLGLLVPRVAAGASLQPDRVPALAGYSMAYSNPALLTAYGGNQTSAWSIETLSNLYQGSALRPGAASDYEPESATQRLELRLGSLSGVSEVRVLQAAFIANSTTLQNTSNLRPESNAAILATSELKETRVAEVGVTLNLDFPAPGEALKNPPGWPSTFYMHRYMWMLPPPGAGSWSASVYMRWLAPVNLVKQLGSNVQAPAGSSYPDTAGPAFRVQLSGVALGPLSVTDLWDVETGGPISQYAAGTHTVLTPDSATTEIYTHVLPWR